MNSAILNGPPYSYKYPYLSFLLCPKYKLFFFKNLQICSARRLLHVDIFFKNIWLIFEKFKTVSMVPVHQIDFPARAFLTLYNTKHEALTGYRFCPNTIDKWCGKIHT
jgi:hypothetical protein